jgi:hypothetical protein
MTGSETTSRPRRVPPAALRTEAGRPLLGEDGALCDPLLVVDLEGERGDLAEAVGAAAAADRVLVGWAPEGAGDPALAPLVAALDLTLVPAGAVLADAAQVGVVDPPAALADLAARVADTPRAATVLTRLLRWTGGLPAAAALEAESLALAALVGSAEHRQWRAGGRGRGPHRLPAPVPGPAVLVEHGGEVLRLTLARPERRNAWGRELREALVAALRAAEQDERVARVVLDGAGPAFCAGCDLDDPDHPDDDPVAAHLARTSDGVAPLLSRLAPRLLVELRGACTGPGIALAAWAGRVTAALDTRIRLPEVAAGLLPGTGGTVSVPRRIGRWRTLYLALSGEEVDAGTALAWGLVDEVH